MLKSASLAIAMTVAASAASAFDSEAPTMDLSLETKQVERAVVLDGAMLQRLSAGAHLGSDIISAMPIIMAAMTGTHFGVDMAAAYAIDEDENLYVQQALSDNIGS